ncbi:MAG: glycosyltransferase family 4 protein [archaeon]
MKVLFIVNIAGLESGILTYAKELKEFLSGQGVKVDVDCLDSKQYDLIHLHNPFPSMFLLETMLRFYGTPIIYSANMTENQVRGLAPETLKVPIRHYLNFFYSRCNKIVCPSEKVMCDLLACKNKTILLPYPVDLQKFKKDEKLGDDFRKKYGIAKSVVMCVASIQERKGIFDFIEAAKSLPDYQFVWVGEIPSAHTLKYRRRIQKIVKNPPKNVLFVGHVEKNDLANAYNAANLFVLPSYSETFGLVIAEAASCGIPVLVRNLPEFSYFGDFAQMFSNQAEFKHKIRQIMDSPEKQKQLSQLSLNSRDKFDAKMHAKKMKEIYESVLSKKS